LAGPVRLLPQFEQRNLACPLLQSVDVVSPYLVGVAELALGEEAAERASRGT